MPFIAAAASWGEDPSLGARVRAMTMALSSWAPDGIESVSHPWFSGAFGRLTTNAAQTQGAFRDDDAGLIVLGDTRLDNANDLSRALGLPISAPHIEILARGHQRWGESLVEKVRGDFAVVVADLSARKVWAFRDEFGVRPLYYAWSAGCLLLASDEEAILAAAPEIRDVDSSSVLGYLLRKPPRPHATMWKAIGAVLPQHVFFANENGGSVSWRGRPPPEPRRFIRRADLLAEFRDALRESVRARLDTDAPALLHLSGGLDSSVINVVADSLRRQGLARSPQLRAVSAIFPGLPCDESVAIRAIAERLSFSHETWNGCEASGLDFFAPSRGGPGRRVAFSGGSMGDLEIARRTEARVLLAGNGGELFSPCGEVLADYFVDRNPGGFVRALRAGRHIHWQKRLKVALGDLGITWTAPRHVRRRRLPRWLSDEARETALDLPVGDRRDVFPSPFLNRQWAYVHGPAATAGFATFRRLGDSWGVSLRFPFLDRRLVDLVFSAPWVMWPSLGYPARFHADAYATDLPAGATNQRKVGFGAAVRAHVLRPEILSRIRGLVGSAGWGDPYLDQPQIMAHLDALTGRGMVGKAQPWIDMYLIATLRAWRVSISS